jgi:hypothetical protein
VAPLYSLLVPMLNALIPSLASGFEYRDRMSECQVICSDSVAVRNPSSLGGPNLTALLALLVHRAISLLLGFPIVAAALGAAVGARHSSLLTPCHPLAHDAYASASHLCSSSGDRKTFSAPASTRACRFASAAQPAPRGRVPTATDARMSLATSPT